MVRLISDIYNSRGKLDAVSRNIEPAGHPLSESGTRIAPPSNRCDSPGECHAANRMRRIVCHCKGASEKLDSPTRVIKYSVRAVTVGYT